MSLPLLPATTIAIVEYLGLPSTEDSFTLVDNLSVTLSSDAGTKLLALLASLASLDTQIATARNIGSPQPYAQLIIEGNRLVRQLSAITGLEVRVNVYQ